MEELAMKQTCAKDQGIKLSAIQRGALVMAYAQGYTMVRSDEPGYGFKTATVDFLLDAELVEPDPEVDDEDAFRATPAGRQALGIRLRPKPRGFKTALEQAIRTFFPANLADEFEFESQPRIRKGATLTLYVPIMRFNDFHVELMWDAVQTLVQELGWPVEVDPDTQNCTVLVTWLDE
jgi:hypothetical protein